MTSWADVEEAVAEHSRLYNEMLTTRQNEQAGSKKVKAAEAAWLDAHDARAAALATHWTEEDGYWFDSIGEKFPSLGAVLRRYYAEMEPVWKERKAAAEAAAKAKKKEDADGA